MGRKPAILAVDMMLRRHSSASHYGMRAGRLDSVGVLLSPLSFIGRKIPLSEQGDDKD